SFYRCSVCYVVFITLLYYLFLFFFFQAEDGIRDATVTGVQTCALPIYFPEHSESDCEAASQSGIVLGNGAADHVHCPRTGPRGACARYKAEVALCDRSELGLVAGARGDRHTNVCRCPAENLEQHAHRDEPRAAPAAFVEGTYGCALQPDQSALSVQYAQHRFGAYPH